MLPHQRRGPNPTAGPCAANSDLGYRQQIVDRRWQGPRRNEIAGEYHDLAIYELRTTGMYQAVKLREKEADRAHREELREQKRVEQEIERKQAKLDKEAQLHRQALATLEAGSASAEQIESLRAKIAEVEIAQADVTKRAANTRAGHVYVISNPGSFGPGVVKIGMTRRLEPMDRVAELGDASVPFRFSVHALIFSDDAVSLKTELHRRFDAHLVEFDEAPINEEWDASQ